MLGKKKKDEAAQPEQQNDLDKPQTLAELDKMAREKKGDDEAAVEDDTDLEHEVTHTDELTADVDVKKVTKSQRRLWVLVVIAIIVLGAGGLFFYMQLEAGQNTGIGGASGNVETTTPTEDGEVVELPRGTFAYVASAGSAEFKQRNVAEDSTASISIGATPSSDARSNVFQISSSSLVKAARTSGGIYVKNISNEHTFLSEQAGSIGQWLLLPDGTQVIALVGSNLYAFDTTSGDGGVVAEGFLPAGSDLSRLNYTRDGSIQIYSKSGGKLLGSIYNLANGEVTTIDRDVIRLERVGPFVSESLSPDGTWMVFYGNINGNQSLQLLSLNSFVLRTIYLAEPGNTPSIFSWSRDSNNLAVFESGAAPRLSDLKVGTLQKEVVSTKISSLASPSWSPSKDYISYVQGGKLRAVKIDTKETQDLIDSVGATDATGWFQN